MRNYFVLLVFVIFTSFFTSCQKEELSAGMQSINLEHAPNNVIYKNGCLDSIIAVAANYNIIAIVAWDTVFNSQICQSLSVYRGEELLARFLPDSYGEIMGGWHPDNFTLSTGAFDGGVLVDFRYSNHILLNAVAKTLFVNDVKTIKFDLPLWSHTAGDTEKRMIQFRQFDGNWIIKSY